MRTGFATPVRRPWLPRARGIRRSRSSIAIAAIVALSAFTTGCADNSPVSAPTSTLPAPQPSETASSPSVPEYTTSLDLTDEEKEAVEGALVAFDGYVATMNRVFSSGGEDLKDADKFATDSSLEALKSSAQTLKDNKQYMAGEYDYYNVRVDSIDKKDRNSEQVDSVIILFCSNDSNRAVVDVGKPMPTQAPKSLTLKHTAVKDQSGWKIANQELWSKSCD